MLYIFHVDTGTMMTFDMNLAMEKVSSLQGVISRGCRIPEDKQVLLISGGESLDPNATVGKYHAGTDTNPIFLFSKTTIESSVPPSPSVNYGSDIDLQGQVEGSLLMPPAYETVVSRAQLALQFQDVDTEELRACERLIHDQHLQQQGWAAVVANLEDVTSELQQRSVTFHETYKEYLQDRQSFKDLITSVTESLQLLSKIPVLPSLLRSTQAISDSESSTENLAKPSLFDWISSQDTNHTLHDMVEQCGKATEQLDQKVDDSLKQEVEQLLREVQNESMKEVKGLEDRLYGLDQIISGARKIVQEQADLAQGFVQNQNRLSNLRDRSILPDLCSSHRSQLIEMMKKHSKLREIKKKCRMAKEELSVNLHTRLRWVMYVEKKICDVDGKLTIYLGNLRRLRKRLDILQQVHDAPKIYAQLVIEVVRRKQFSSKFLSWATTLAEDSAKLHNEEVKRRDSFLRVIGHHFLQAMFQGFDDFPPAFATEAPDLFDCDLPEITADDIRSLKESVPELSGILSLPVEEELFVALANASDTSVQWVDGANHTIEVLRRTKSDPGAETMNKEEGLQPYSLDVGSVSLGEQFEECEEEGEIVCKPGIVTGTPPDKEFLLPKSLSEELTVEIKESHSVKDLQCGIPDGSTPIDSRPVVQAQPSEPTSLRRKSQSVYSKPLSETSPDMETSQEFATADFYFDESMPSSIESPPKTSSEAKAELEKTLLAEKQMNAKLQQQLIEANRKISQSDEALKALKEYFSTYLPLLKDNAKDLKKEQEEHVQTLIKEMEELRNKVIQIVQSYDKNVCDKSQSEINKMADEMKESENIYAEKMKLENEKTRELESMLEKLKDEAEEQESKFLDEIKAKDELKVQFDDMQTKLSDEIKQLTQKFELEVEVEVDKAKSECAETIDSLEKEIEAKDKIILERDSAIAKIEKDKVKLEETLIDKFQVEKDQICNILGKEYEEKLEKAAKEHEERMEVMKQSVIAELSEKHEQEKEQKIEELKQSLMVEKVKAVEMTQSTLTLEHSKIADELKTKLLEEKSAEFEKYKMKMEAKLQEDVVKFSAEFNKEKEQLVTELNSYKNREFTTCEIQTSTSVFNSCSSDTQTNPVPVTLHIEAQTEISDQLSTSMQTVPSDLTHLSTQTDSAETTSSTNQTDKAQVVEYSMQTDEKHFDHMFVQTEAYDAEDDSDNSDKTCSSETQTEHLVADSQDAHSQAELEEAKKQLQEFDKRLAEKEVEHEAEISRLVALIEKEKEDALQLKTSLTSMTGDKQTKFNEAVNRVSREKDRVIEELKIKESQITEEIKQMKEQIRVLREEKSKAEDVKERAMIFLKDKEAALRHLETELGLAQRQVQQYRQQLQSAGLDTEDNTAVTSSPSVVQLTDPEVQQRIKDLEDVVRLKDEELSRMQQKVMELSMSASTRSLVQDKVSITSCHVGDLVLLCLDERLDLYVVFTVGNTLHFLHTECLSPLGLKTESGEAKKQWLIAEVIDKEYCQAKKANNRFKVPVGTKFYRVKAKPWKRESNQSPAKKSDTASAP